jgi:hypothetical protein
MSAHKLEMVAIWARENGIEGFDHLDPKNREKNRQRALKATARQNERKETSE